MTSRERAVSVPAAESAALVRRLLNLPNREPVDAGPRALWAALVDHLWGRSRGDDPAALVDAAPAAAMEAARAFVCLHRPLDAFTLLTGLEPHAHPALLPTALRVVPLVPPDSLFAQRRWAARLFFALRQRGLRAEITTLVHALHARGHFDLVDALNRSKLAEVVPDESWRLIQATQACWEGRYADVGALLDGVALAGSRRVEADLLLAIARSRTARPPTDAEMRSLIERAAHVPGLDETAERWRAELFVRAGSDDPRTVAQIMARASDHVAVRLLYRIIECGALSGPMRDNPNWGFHTYVLDALRDAGLDEARVASESEGTPAEAAALWRVLDRLGGNRTDVVTYVAGDGVRPLDLRTARQEAVATQARLPQDGAARVHARFAALAAAHPDLSVFATYRAEVLLWEGRYEEAVSLFEAEVRTAATRWGEVGLGAALAALGREDEAERVWARGHERHQGALPGEATFVYRAEIAARHGRLPQARELLESVLAAKPTRPRGWLLRAELAWLTGEYAEARAALLCALALCPGLASAVGGPPGELAELLLGARRPTHAERDSLIDWCRGLRTTMRGNASSWMFTWFDGSGVMRSFRWLPHADLAQAVDAITCLTLAGSPREPRQR